MKYFNIGDRLVREKGFIFSKHHAIFAGLNEKGVETVAENQLGIGVRFIPLSQFLNEGKLVRVEKFDGSFSERKEVLRKINQLIGTPYDLMNFNCEHFCNLVLFGKIESKQIRAAGLILGLTAIGTLAYYATQNQNDNRENKKIRRA